MKRGKVWLVGAGPSDPGLLTLKAKKALEEAEVVLYDSLVGPGVLAVIPEGVRLIDVGKRAGRAHMSQERINKTLLEEALKGCKVVRLKGGDPFLFGRGGEELELLAEHGIPFEIVPGVTSAIAVPAYAGIPVTHRDFCSSVHIVAGRKKDSDRPDVDFEALARLKGTLVFLMGAGALEYICSSLISAGMDAATPAAVLEKGASARQRRVVATLASLPEAAARAELKTPAIIVVGEVCGLAERFHWAEDRPLGGARVVVTRPRELASRLSETLRGMGAEVVELPAIKTVEIRDNAGLDRALENLSDYDWIVFTSQAGVGVFFDRLLRSKKDARSLSGIRLAAIGGATEKALAERGVIADCVPEKYDSSSLGRALAAAARPGERLLIPRARIGSRELTRELDAAGLVYDDIPVYDTQYAAPGAVDVGGLLAEREGLYAAFTSASTVRGFAAMAGGADRSRVKAVCIGEQTAAEAARLGMEVYVSDDITVDSLAEKIAELHRASKER